MIAKGRESHDLERFDWPLNQSENSKARDIILPQPLREYPVVNAVIQKAAEGLKTFLSACHLHKESRMSISEHVTAHSRDIGSPGHAAVRGVQLIPAAAA